MGEGTSLHRKSWASTSVAACWKGPVSSVTALVLRMCRSSAIQLLGNSRSVACVTLSTRNTRPSAKLQPAVRNYAETHSHTHAPQTSPPPGLTMCYETTRPHPMLQGSAPCHVSDTPPPLTRHSCNPSDTGSRQPIAR